MDVEATRHISLFALAPIPVLAYLGHCLSNKITVEMYQRHRTGEPWKWKTDGEVVEYEIRRHGEGGDESCAALIVSVSGSIDITHLPREIADRCSVFEIRVRGQTPNPDALRQRDDLEGFRTKYRKFLAELGRDQPQIKELHIFPAVPAPIAVALGHDLLPKVHPTLLLYDNDKSAGGFISRLRINDNDKR
jgi:hypothetical protein